MRDRTRTILTGGLMGLLVATALAVPSVLPPAMADEEPARTLLSTGAELFPKRIDGDDYVKPNWTVEPWVSTDVLEETTIRKIGYGRTEFVTIMTTATGTYSSDGLKSPHIRYPGIIQNAAESSFKIVLPIKGGRMVITPDSTCIRIDRSRYC